MDLALEAARRLEGVEGVLVYARAATAELEAAARGAAAPIRAREAWDPASLLRQALEDAKGYDHVYYLWADAPYLDLAVSARMMANHTRYYADYSFADGYPLGLCPEILKTAVLAPLAKLAEQHSGPLGRDLIFQVVQRDINAFDLETELSEVDLRSLRLTLAADTRRNFTLLQRLEAEGVRNAADVTRVVTAKPGILRTLPAYCNVQIVEGCPQLCTYCPYPLSILRARGVTRPGKVDEMPAERFASLLDDLTGFAGDIVVSVSLWGEPSLHSRIADLVVDAAHRPGVTLHVETSGVGWATDALHRIHESGARPVWIVSLDAWGPEHYARMRGPGFTEALETAELLRRLYPESTYLQAVRVRGGEEDTESFYRGWKERGGKTIIQKYDSFAGRLEDRKVSDLSPVRRVPCWHVKRDLVVLMDGSAPMCRESLDAAQGPGNVFTDGVQAVWARGEELYALHLAERYPAICQGCDEYYTYNA